jgi:predicted N-acyltransferase
MTVNHDAEIPSLSYLTQLEPDALVHAFFAHPPQDFKAWKTAAGVPVFAAAFDLLTTVDTALRKTISRLPLYRYWGRWLKPYTCFVGTTVSEYTLLPATTPADALAVQLKTAFARDYAFLIIKDIPQSSPLLGAAANQYAQNLSTACEHAGFVMVEGQALAWVPIDFDSVDDYLARLSSSRRKNIRRKLKMKSELDISLVATGSACFFETSVLDAYYALYLNVFQQSEIHFDLLTRDFFNTVLQNSSNGGLVFEYRHEGHLIGYNICFVVGDTLVDKYVGFSYPQARDFNLYFISWFHNIEYAKKKGLARYIAGWTDPEVKASLGAQFTFTRHAVYIRNPILRALLGRLSRYFESDRQWRDAHDAEGESKK